MQLKEIVFDVRKEQWLSLNNTYIHRRGNDFLVGKQRWNNFLVGGAKIDEKQDNQIQNMYVQWGLGQKAPESREFSRIFVLKITLQSVWFI